MLKRVLLGLSCGALLIAGVLWMVVGANSPRYEVLFELKLSEDDSYASTGLEQQAWGPAAVAVAYDGTIWVADGAGRRLLGFASTGKAVRTISLDDAVVGIGDLDAFGDELVVLDIAAPNPAIVRVSTERGTVGPRIPVPPEAGVAAGLSGIAIQEDGTVVAELTGGDRIVPIDPPPATPAGVQFDHRTGVGLVRITAPDAPGGRRGSVWVNGTRVPLPVPGSPGPVGIVGSTSTVVAVSSQSVGQDADGSLVVEEAIRLIGRTGEILATTAVPLDEFAVPVDHPAALSPQGDVVALVPLKDRVLVVRLLPQKEAPFTEAPAFRDSPPAPGAGVSGSHRV